MAVSAGGFASTSGLTTFAGSARGGEGRSSGACGTGRPAGNSVFDGSEGAALGPASLGACSFTTEDGAGAAGACAFSVSAVLVFSELVDAGGSLDGPGRGALTGSLGSALLAGCSLLADLGVARSRAGAFATSISVLFLDACCFHITAMEMAPAISRKVAAPVAAERQKLLRALARWRVSSRS